MLKHNIDAAICMICSLANGILLMVLSYILDLKIIVFYNFDFPDSAAEPYVKILEKAGEISSFFLGTSLVFIVFSIYCLIRKRMKREMASWYIIVCNIVTIICAIIFLWASKSLYIPHLPVLA